MPLVPEPRERENGTSSYEKLRGVYEVVQVALWPTFVVCGHVGQAGAEGAWVLGGVFSETRVLALRGPSNGVSFPRVLLGQGFHGVGG